MRRPPLTVVSFGLTVLLTLHLLSPVAIQAADLSAEFTKEINDAIATMVTDAKGQAIAKKVAESFTGVTLAETETALKTYEALRKAGKSAVEAATAPTSSERSNWETIVEGLLASAMRELEQRQKVKTTDPNTRDKLLPLVKAITSALKEAGPKAATDRPSASELGGKIDQALSVVSDNPADPNRQTLAAEIVRQIQSLQAENEQYRLIDTAAQRLKQRIQDALAIPALNGLTATQRSNITQSANVVIEEIVKMAGGDVKKLIELLKSEVLPRLKHHSKTDGAIESRFGLDAFVIARARAREQSELERDVLRQLTAAEIAAVYRKAALKVAAPGETRSGVEFAQAEVVPQITAILTKVNARVAGDVKPWDLLREEISLQLILLEQEQGRFSRDSKVDLQTAWTELANGFDAIAKRFQEDSALKSSEKSVSSKSQLSSGSTNLFGSDGLSVGSAYELKTKLEIRREVLKLQREFVEDEYRLRRSIARKESEGRRKQMQEQLDQVRKEFESRLKTIERD